MCTCVSCTEDGQRERHDVVADQTVERRPACVFSKLTGLLCMCSRKQDSPVLILHGMVVYLRLRHIVVQIGRLSNMEFLAC